MAGDCPDPENSPDPIGVPVNLGGCPDSRERRLGPGQARDTRNGNAPWVRQGRGAEGAERAETPERAESFTVRGCRAASPGWLR